MKLLLTLTALLAFYGVDAKPRNFDRIIVNGVNAQPGEAPYQVFLRQEVSSTSWRICGATLIKANKVLTAAHCIVPGQGDVYIRYGTQDRTVQVYPDVKVSKIARHPNYNEAALMNDIAVLTLEKNIAQDSRVKYAVLQTAEVQTNAQVTIYGWGRLSGTQNTTPNKLQKTTLKVTSTDSTKIYARGTNSIACQGDSGGVMISADGKQCGVTSAVEVGCPPGGINVYTKVSAFISWINQQ